MFLRKTIQYITCVSVYFHPIRLKLYQCFIDRREEKT